MSTPTMTVNQPSLTEWIAAVGNTALAEELRKEDNAKADRLEILFQIAGIPYERPEKFTGTDVWNKTGEFAKILAERGDELCAFRVVPTDPSLPKLRERGRTIADCYANWFLKQSIDPSKYNVYVCPHTNDTTWSCIFVVNERGVWGEVVRGRLSQLNHGEHASPVYRFEYNGAKWSWSGTDHEAPAIVERMLKTVTVNDEVARTTLKEKLNIDFFNNAIHGYFEATVWPGDKIYFTDYNRVLPKLLQDHPAMSESKITANQQPLVKGRSATPGIAHGPVVLVSEDETNTINFSDGSILVCRNTDVRYVSLMKKSAAIVTDQGGMLSHAAIVSRELKKPCIVGTIEGTQILKNGMTVTVDANIGIVTKS